MDSKETHVDAIDRIDSARENHVPQGSTLPFWKQTELRKLYGMMLFLFLGSTTLGYDGSLLNGLQTMDSWQECMTTKHQARAFPLTLCSFRSSYR